MRNSPQFDGIWIYRSTVISDKQEDAALGPIVYPIPSYRLNKKTVYMNGQKLEDNGHFTFNAGKNDLLIVYETWSGSDTLSEENAAFFCRIVSRQAPPPSRWDETRSRIRTLQYTLP
jgi:hypothetical protein